MAELRALVSKQAEELKRNSTNSNKPSSSDGPGGGARVGRRKKKPTGRKRGGQKGRKGAHRRLVDPELVDTVHGLYPEHCERCAATLPRQTCHAPDRFQQTDIRDGKRHVDEWRLHEVSCPRCRARTRAPYDPTRIPTTAFGPGLVAVVAVLTGRYHLSRRQARAALHDLFGISISLGSVSQLEHRASEALAPAYEEAKAMVEDALVKHTDAASWLRSGSLTSLWVLACASVTVYAILRNGKAATIREELQQWMVPVQRHVERLLQRAAVAGYAEVSGSCRDILAHAEALWTFVVHEGVEPTNNHAELMLRPFVLWRK